MSEAPMKFHVRGSLIDLVAFARLIPTRRRRNASAPPRREKDTRVDEIARALHPAAQGLVIESARDESPSCRTYRLVPDPSRGTKSLAYFRAGQYLSLKASVGGVEVSRPYSISSSPSDALAGFYEVTIKRAKDGLFSSFALDRWKAGDRILASAPAGFAYYEPLRDPRSLVGIAGGSGVTMFRSMAREMAAGRLDVSLTLVYGCSATDDIPFRDEFAALESKLDGRFKAVYVFSCEDVDPAAVACYEKGFITGGTLRKYCDPSTDAFFLCGPQAMYDFVLPELAALGVPRRRIRREAYGEVKDPARFASFPRSAVGKTFAVTARVKGGERKLAASSGESLLAALERSRIAPPSSCRSGECQYCRTRLVSGEVWISPESDGRRAADRKFGYIHPCASFPVSDLEIVLPPSIG